VDYKRVRTLTVTALFSDDWLFERLVLKGGNAISLVHGLSSRVSLDLDFSMEEGFENLDEARDRMERALRERFAPFEIEPLDVSCIGSLR
jgi:predicted nucleotidyltransferase component of viral defense system